MNKKLVPAFTGCLIAAMLAHVPSLLAAELAPVAPPRATPDSLRLPPSVPVAPSTMREPKDKTGTAAPAKGQNCGTFWTGWLEDPNADANPCPKDCVRGERQLVKTHKQGSTMLYSARYQCYRMATVSPPKAEPPGGIKEHPREAFRPKVITTEALQLTGTRRPPFAPKIITTEPIQLTGIRRPPFTPKVITTEPMQLTGTRPPRLPLKTDRPVKLPPASGVPAKTQ